MRTIIIVILTISVMANMTGKARADITTLLPTDFFLMVMERQDRIEVINRFFALNAQNDDYGDKEILFVDYNPDTDIPELDFSGFSEDEQRMVTFTEPYIIIMEISDFYPFIYDKEAEIHDRIELLTQFHEQNPEKDFLILDYDSDSGETQIFEIPDFSDISELIKWIESSTGWQLDEPYSAADQIADLIESFYESVENGDLEGRGSGWLAKLRLFLLREMLLITGELIEYDRINAACIILKRAHMRCDGNVSPLSDFVIGDATEELDAMIQDLRISLGCE